jgi:aminoglycoside/choline kinase family phosphotransferase
MTTIQRATGPASGPDNDLRLQQLSIWASQVLARPNLAITTASADASFRRYFRASAGADATEKTWIIMDAPPAKEDVEPFVRVAKMLVEAELNAPQILAQNSSQGFLLLSDLGKRTYLTELMRNSRVDSLYSDALTTLVEMQSRCTRVQELPEYDAALLQREMDLFPEWFLEQHLGIKLPAALRAELATVFAYLSDAALAQPRVFVHRDYHSRNLMITDGGAQGRNPGVLDFQDAVYGPVTYDLVSLLRDCYVDWPLERVHGWVREYRGLATKAGLNVGISEDQLLRWFDLMGVQRHLKAIGIFARLWHRDGKQGYLGDIPRTLNYIRTVAPSYAELRPLTQLIEAEVVQALARV